MIKKQKKKNTEIETTFPPAQEILAKTAKNWSTKTAEKILVEIQKRSSAGERYVWFFNSTISKQTCEELREKGYHVYVSNERGGAPCFKISW